MTDDFILSVTFNNKILHFTAKLLLQGYSHKFEVDIYGVPVLFEPDDGGNYRVLAMPGQDEKELMKIDKKLLEGICQKIEAILA